MEQKENIFVRPHYEIRLKDLRSWHKLRAECRRCGHRAALHAEVLHRRWSGEVALMKLEKRLRCTHCKNRKGNQIAIVPIKRD